MTELEARELMHPKCKSCVMSHCCMRTLQSDNEFSCLTGDVSELEVDVVNSTIQQMLTLDSTTVYKVSYKDLKSAVDSAVSKVFQKSFANDMVCNYLCRNIEDYFKSHCK